MTKAKAIGAVAALAALATLGAAGGARHPAGSHAAASRAGVGAAPADPARAGAGIGAAPADPARAGAGINAALADPARADQAGDDLRRQAAAVLAFTGVKAGDTVIDLIPGQGYWSRILTGVVGSGGHVYAIWPTAAAKMADKPMAALQARGLANLTAAVQPAGAPLAPVPVDLVLTVQNYHDVANSPTGEAAIDAFNAEIFQALKPGGSYVVVDHADAPGTGLTGTSTRHRIDPAIVRTEVARAGFVFVGSSDVLRNPADDHSLKVFDAAIKGHTDQFAYRFKKPG